MADPTLQESAYKKSVRKYFIDTLETGLSIHTFFDRQYSIPKHPTTGEDLDKWVVVGFRGIKIGNLSRGSIEVICFSRYDDGGVELSNLRDIIVDMLVDENMSDGCRRIPYYDDSWTQIGGMVAHIGDYDSGTEYGADGTLFRNIIVTLNWGTK